MTALPTAAILVGPTASGKTALAVAAAAHLPIEVISADSRQVYRGLDIGTAKPTPSEQGAVRHHLIDILAVHETYNAARFAQDALHAATAIGARGRIPLVVGGAGFYVKVLEDGLFDPPYTPAELAAVRADLEGWNTDDLRVALIGRDPQRAAAIHPNDRYRLARALEICLAAGRSVSALTAERLPSTHRFIEFRVEIDRAVLHARIAARASAMLESGWQDEVRRALDAGAERGAAGLASLGYPHVLAHLEGQIDRQRLLELVSRDTRRFARAQETWFRKMHRATLLPALEPKSIDVLVAALGAAFQT